MGERGGDWPKVVDPEGVGPPGPHSVQTGESGAFRVGLWGTVGSGPAPGLLGCSSSPLPLSSAMDGVPFTLHPRFEGKSCGPLVSPGPLGTWVYHCLLPF